MVRCSKVFVLIVCVASAALAEDFKTITGKEYKNVTVSRVEPDGIVLRTKSGISKLYFTELPKDVQERFHYDKDQATAYAADQNAKLDALGKQQEESLGLAVRSKAAQRSLTIFPAKDGGLRIEHESYAQLLSEAKTKATNLNYN